MLTDPEQKIARPRQIYIGSATRDYVSRDKRRVDRGSRSRFTVRARVARCAPALADHAHIVDRRLLATVTALSACLAQHSRRRHSRCDSTAQQRARRTCAAWSRSDRGRPAARRSPRPATTSRQAADGARPDGRRAGVRGRHAGRPDQDGQPARDDPGGAVARPKADHRRRPLRHQAVQGVHVRRRQRRRLERGVPDRAGARAEGGRRPRSRSSCCSSTARKRSGPSGRARITPTAAATTSTPRGRTGRSPASGADPGRHDRRPRPADQARVELHAWLTDLIWGAAAATRAAGVRRRKPRRSRTTTCRSSRPASRRSTSSISTTRPGTPRTTRWTS